MSGLQSPVCRVDSSTDWGDGGTGCGLAGECGRALALLWAWREAAAVGRRKRGLRQLPEGTSGSRGACKGKAWKHRE